MTNSSTNPSTNPTSPSTSPASKPEKNRYRDTLHLPKTPFPMKASLVQNEPQSVKRWQAMNLYQRVMESRVGREPFSFHCGPPYANGSLHLGHLMNITLKDFVVRSQSMMGKLCPFVPGWDCHGLPIEHKVMTDLVVTKPDGTTDSSKLDKVMNLPDEQRRMAIRRECQKHAEKFIKLQASQMVRLFLTGDFENPYLTMQPAYEAGTLEVLATLLERGLVYRALKPVHWSIANETALADAELEYQDREDVSVYVDFEAADADAVYDAFGLPAASDEDDDEEAEGDGTGTEKSGGAPRGRPGTRPSFMIWTTTPWTLPANLAIAVNPAIEYALVFVDGNVTVLAVNLVEKVMQLARAEEVSVLATAPGEKLVGLRYRHPFVAKGPEHLSGQRNVKMDRVFTIIGADYVTLEDGSGLVHTAPGHGEEDYMSGLREGLPVYCPVLGNGTYDATVPEWLRGIDVWTANTKVVQHLRDSGHLFFEQKFSHSYPHDWRSKTPTIFRCTEQWFVGVDRGLKVERPGGVRETTLRHAAVDAIDHDVTFVPEWGRNRMRGMVESRPDWCISRQRSWGLPIPAFFTPEGECVMTGAIVRAVAAVVRAKGSDAWYQLPAAELLAAYQPAQDAELPASAKASSPAQWKKGMDILDVWFEAGSSWNSAVRQRGQAFPSDLYLEGSDQHRGWFQLSLLPSLGVTGQSPFKQCFTHGFTVDKDGRKLSKSKGDTLEKLFEDYGVDVLRWWVSSLPYENDVKVDREFFDQAGESYRKVRNTIRFLLSNLFDFKEGDAPDVRTLPPASLDAWIVGEFDALVKTVVEAYRTYQFRDAHQAIYNFCNETLSAVYLAAVKDRMYCDAAGSVRRRRTQSAIHHIADGLCRLLAPIMCHTADEAYRAMLGVEASDQRVSVHLLEFPQPTGLHPDPRWREVIERRRFILGKLESEKRSMGLDNPLDAGLRLADPGEVLAHFDPVDLADLLGVSRVEILNPDQARHPAGVLALAFATPGGIGQSEHDVLVLDLRSEPRCERSWKRDGTVKPRSDGGVLSDRDAAVLGVG